MTRKHMSLKKWIKYHANSHHAGSYTNRLRKERMKVFEAFFLEQFREELENRKRIRILDVGGTYSFWKAMTFRYVDCVDITLANLAQATIPDGITNIHSIVADARNMNQLEDHSFDLVFSNSVIEHVGDIADQAKMANEVKRIGKHYFLQTPNRYFPIEPHFLFPLFQFFPLCVRTFLVRHFQLGFWPQGKTKEEARRIADEIHLLSYRDLVKLFPRAVVKREKIFGMTKSFMLFE